MDFLKVIDLIKFAKKVESWPHFLCNEWNEEINKELNDKNKEQNRIKYDYLLCGDDVLNYIYNDGYFIEKRYNEKTGEPYEYKKGVGIIEGLVNDEKFFGESLFCEWGYVIDLDKNVFEIYKGFNETDLTEEDRFFYMQNSNDEHGFPWIKSDKYKAVKIAGCYPLNKLPKTLNEKTLKKSLQYLKIT